MRSYLDPEEVERMIEVMPSMRDKLILKLLWRTGIRVSELINLKKEDIDFGERMMTIRSQKERTQALCPVCGAVIRKTYAHCVGCGEKIDPLKVKEFKRQEQRIRKIPVDSDTLEHIKAYLGVIPKKWDKLFPLSRHQLKSIVYRAAELSGLGGKSLKSPVSDRECRVHPHTLRASFAHFWLSRRNDPEGELALQRHLGHRSFSTTARYLERSTEELHKVYDDIFKEG